MFASMSNSPASSACLRLSGVNKERDAASCDMLRLLRQRTTSERYQEHLLLGPRYGTRDIYAPVPTFPVDNAP